MAQSIMAAIDTSKNSLVNVVTKLLDGLDVARHIQTNTKEQNITLPIEIDHKLHKIIFIVEPNFYTIRLSPFVGITQLEDENINENDVVADLLDLYSLIKAGKLFLIKKSFLGKTAYKCDGLGDNYGFTLSISEAFILYFGHVVAKNSIRLKK